MEQHFIAIQWVGCNGFLVDYFLLCFRCTPMIYIMFFSSKLDNSNETVLILLFCTIKRLIINVSKFYRLSFEISICISLNTAIMSLNFTSKVGVRIKSKSYQVDKFVENHHHFVKQCNPLIFLKEPDAAQRDCFSGSWPFRPSQMPEMWLSGVKSAKDSKFFYNWGNSLLQIFFYCLQSQISCF